MTHKTERQIIKDLKEDIKRLQEELNEKSNFCFSLMDFIMNNLKMNKDSIRKENENV